MVSGAKITIASAVSHSVHCHRKSAHSERVCVVLRAWASKGKRSKSFPRRCGHSAPHRQSNVEWSGGQIEVLRQTGHYSFHNLRSICRDLAPAPLTPLESFCSKNRLLDKCCCCCCPAELDRFMRAIVA